MAKLFIKENYCYFNSIKDYIKDERFMVIDNDTEYQDFKNKVDKIIDLNIRKLFTNMDIINEWMNDLSHYESLPIWEKWFTDKPAIPKFPPPSSLENWIAQTYCRWGMPMHIPEDIYLEIVG
jgi:hypothetical protein